MHAGEERRIIRQKDLSPQVRRHIMHRMELILAAAARNRRMLAATKLNQTLVFGSCRYNSTGVSVEVAPTGQSGAYIGHASMAGLPPKERAKWYLKGDRCWYVHKASRSESNLLVLNRISINLPKLLIEHLAWQEGVNVTVTPLERNPGAYTSLMLSTAVPPEVLKAAHDELGEKIKIVR